MIPQTENPAQAAGATQSRGKPKAAVFYTEGNNRMQESQYAFEQAGAKVEQVHLSEFKSGNKKINDYQILFFPGGFSHGDHLASGKIWAAQCLAYFKDELQAFIEQDKLIIGICNGFQFLVRLGLLPFQHLGKIEASLTHNASGHFECRWVRLRVEKSPCIFTRGMEGQILRTPVSHGEGRFWAPPDAMEQLERNQQVVFRYMDENGEPTQNYPQNPNGALNAIAGITSPNGRIFGAMPHPECNTKWNHYPNWNNPEERGGECLSLFKNAVEYFK